MKYKISTVYKSLSCYVYQWESRDGNIFHCLQYAWVESLGRRWLLSMCFYHLHLRFCVQDWLWACWGGRTMWVTPMSHLLDEAFTHGQLQDASPGWGQRLTQHPTSLILLVRSVIVSLWSHIYVCSILFLVGASVSEPHTSESNWDFSSNIIIIIFCRTSFRIFSML